MHTRESHSFAHMHYNPDVSAGGNAVRRQPIGAQQSPTNLKDFPTLPRPHPPSHIAAE